MAPADEIAARERQQLENDKQIRELAPVYTDLIQINYADAEEIAEVLAGAGEETSLLTERGSVQVVARTNSLLVKDTQEKLDELRALIQRLDIPVRQVMIEARIVNMNSDFTRDLGVKWSGATDLASNDSNRSIGIGGGGTTAGNEGGTPSAGVGNNPFIDFGVTGTNAATLAIGFATNSTILNLELSAILSDGVVKRFLSQK